MSSDLCLVAGSALNAAWIRDTCDSGVRLDGRTGKERRPCACDILSINQESHDDNIDSISIEQRIGNTRVACILTAKIVSPHQERPEEGIFRIGAIQGPEGYGRHGALGSSTRKLVHTRHILDELDLLDRKHKTLLCIVPGEAVWSIELALSVIRDDGAVLDAVFLGIMKAFENFPLFKRLGISPPKLSMVSFVILDGGPDNFLIDPTLQEENMSGRIQGCLTICIDKDKQTCIKLYYHHHPFGPIHGSRSAMGDILEDCISTACSLV
jgi:exosome complex RNA-binding protein Rrp42 (RNase PH superfamily)